MTSPDSGRLIEASGVSLYVEDHGEGEPVLLLHGWPDSARLWRHQVFFQFAGVAEATLQHDDWAMLRMLSRGDGDQEQWIADLSRPGALTASLNWYRANLAPRMPGLEPELPPVTAPTLGIWPDRDHYLDGERMEGSHVFVKGPWHYEEIPGASHWVPLDAPDRLNELLLDWLR